MALCSIAKVRNWSPLCPRKEILFSSFSIPAAASTFAAFELTRGELDLPSLDNSDGGYAQNIYSV